MVAYVVSRLDSGIDEATRGPFATMEEAIGFLSDAAGSSPGAGFAVDWTSVASDPAERLTAERGCAAGPSVLPWAGAVVR